MIKFNKDSVLGTMVFALALSLFCSFLITGTAEILKERKIAKKRNEIKRYVLVAANQPTDDFVDFFDDNVKPQLVDLNTGKAVDGEPMDFDPKMAAINKDTSIKPKKDLAKIKRRANVARIYKVYGDDGKLASVVLPIYGKGLWSIVYGYIAIQPDLNTIENVVFYEHGETPGIADFVTDPSWAAQWHDKQLFDAKGKVAFKVVKGGAKEGDVHGVDAVSGATKTGRGIQKSVQFWFGQEGFNKVLEQLKTEVGA